MLCCVLGWPCVSQVPSQLPLDLAMCEHSESVCLMGGASIAPCSLLHQCLVGNSLIALHLVFDQHVF